MEMLPKVTIGLCVKNNEPTIQFTIDSILKVNYPANLLELIVVDGMSKDRTVEIITQTLKNSSISYKLLSDEGRGLAYARQMVVDNATGEFIQWVDGDHVIPRDFILKQVKFIMSDEKLGAAEAITKHIGKSWISKLEGYTWLYYGLRRANIKELESVGSAGTIYRVSAIKSVGGYDTKIRGAGEDGDLSRRMRKAGWRLAMNPTAYYYHITRQRLRDLLKEYYWYGYGAYYVARKHSGEVTPIRFLPPLPLLSGLRHSIFIYLLTKDSTSFLLPIHYSLKRLAWIYGYSKAYINKYGW